jgi:hypothetical protein
MENGTLYGRTLYSGGSTIFLAAGLAAVAGIEYSRGFMGIDGKTSVSCNNSDYPTMLPFPGS